MKKEEFLKILGFEEKSKNIYEKFYLQHNYKIVVDLKKGKVFYRDDEKIIEDEKVKPDGKILIGEKTSSNLKQSESWVVLDAVNRLLEKGYSPAHIHIEKKWKLGRTAKGGRADIIVYERELDDGYLVPLMIIECKTWGKEFEKEKQRLKRNGGQLFSYLQQERNAKYLVLYASDLFENNEGYFIDYDNVIIKVIDDEKKLKECQEENKKKKRKKPCSFKETANKEELFEIWKNLYRSYWYKYGIFEKDILAYDIELKPLKKKDLIELKNPQGLFNKFAEILRHNNISDNANAFNKMLNLFLCKIVDEEEKAENDELDFQVKGDEEYEKLVDRLQRLYYIGMKKHLNIYDFVYYSDEDIEKFVKLYPRETPIERILQIFKEVKYYTNNEFAFKEIHNKKLFDENVEILIEVIELLQPYKFKYSHKYQFLGDFFELLLDFGVKQSEGQFFTPMPIVNFINGSLKIEDIINLKLQIEEFSNKPLPKFLDYACGAGHFITDMMDKIGVEVEKNETLKEFVIKNPNWQKYFIYGIEKDYRLARTSKLACFLAGDGEATIIYGDGLDEHKELELEKEKIDILSTNPPYSVRNFKKYLDVKVDYELLSYLTENSKEIEVLFIERAKQVLKEDIGRIGIILPSSILSNLGVYEKAREILLKHFEIKAIVELGGNAFIATGTNTIVLFLKRRNDDVMKDRKLIAEEIFNGNYFKDERYKNSYLEGKRFFDMFINYREFSKEDYYKFVLEDILTEKLLKTDIFKDYKNWFEKEVKKIKKTKEFKRKSTQEQKQYLDELFINVVKEKEKEKFFYFMLTFYNGKEYNDPKFYEMQNLFVVKAPNKTEEQKEFLGYEFSKRRGYEGLILRKDENGKLTTKLYDEKNFDNPKKISAYIRASFNDKVLEVDEEIKTYGKWYKLADLIDFEKVNFDKNISLTPKKVKFINSKWEMVRLGDVVEILQGLVFDKNDKSNIETSIKVLTNTHIELKTNKINLQENSIFLKDDFKVDVDKKLKKDDIFIATSSGSLKHLGKVAYIDEDLDYFAGGFCSIIRCNKSKIIPKFLFELLKSDNFKDFINTLKGSNINNLNQETLKSLKIPLPPLEIQKKIVEKIEEFEKKNEKNVNMIKNLKEEIKELIENSMNYKKIKLENIAKDIIMGQSPSSRFYNKERKGLPFYQGKKEFGEIYLKSPTIWTTDCKKYANKNELLISVRAPVGDVNLNPYEKICIGRGLAVIKITNEVTNKFMFYLLKNKVKELINTRIGTSFEAITREEIKSLKIPLPPLEVQERIVKEIEKLEEEINNLKEINKEIRMEIEKVLNKYF